MAILMTNMIGGVADLQQNPYFEQSGFDHEEYFGTVSRSMYTLFQAVTTDRWAHIVTRHVLASSPL